MHVIEKLQILTEITESLAVVSSRDDIFDHILTSVRTMYDVDYAAILLRDNVQNDYLTIVCSRGYSEERTKNRKVRLGEGVTGRVAATGRPIMINDVTAEENYLELDEKVRSELAVPLRAEGRVAGVLTVESARPFHFEPEDLEILTLFAAEASAFLHQCHLRDESQRTTRMLERRASQLLNLSGVARSMTSGTSIRAVLTDILLTLREFVPAGDRFAFLLYDKQVNRLVLKSLIGYDQTMVDTFGVEPGKGITGAAFADKCEIIINDVSREPRFISYGIDGISSEMALPLVIQGEALGVIDIASSVQNAFRRIEKDFIDTLIGFASVAVGNAKLFEENRAACFETIRSLAEALEARDAYTKGHSERVTRYAVGVAEKLGLSVPEQEMLAYAGLLHDIGKIGVRDIVLNKEGKLDCDEFDLIRSHPDFGERILRPVSFLDEVRLAVRHHHERFDGNGYPDRLSGEAIPLLSRIIAVADAFDAMTSTRPYRLQSEHESALDELKQHSGSQFDPVVVNAFIEYWRSYGQSSAQSA